MLERDDSAAEVLEVGRDPRIRRTLWPARRWRRLTALAVTLIVGLAAGAGGTYWLLTSNADREDKAAVHLLARVDGGVAVVDPADLCATATIQLTNVGAYPLTVERLYADLTGRGSDQSLPACQLQESTPHPTALEPRASKPWTIVFRLDCDQAWGTPTFRATVTTESGERREVVESIEQQEPAPQPYSCDGSPDITWDNVAGMMSGTGARASLVVSGVIHTRTGRAELLALRLADGSGLEMRLEPDASMAVDTRPRPISARLSVADCRVARDLPDSSIELRVRTRLGRSLVVIPFDEPRSVTRSLVSLVDEACSRG